MNWLRIVLLVTIGSLLWCSNAGAAAPTIEKVVSNPASDGNKGEYIVINGSEIGSLGGWDLRSGGRAVTLPNVTSNDPVAVSENPRTTAILTEYETVGFNGYFPLTTDGFSLVLVSPEGDVEHEIAVPSLGTQEAYYPENPVGVGSQGVSEFDFEPHDVTHMIPFVLPDSPEIPREVIAAADEQILISGYELSDPVIVDLLVERYQAGVDVRVVIDGRPVGGQEEMEIQALDTLSTFGIPIRTLTGDRDRYRFHHPKFAVVDDSAIVMTENWKPAGTGGQSSRGWGVFVADPSVTEDLRTVFMSDFAWRDTIAWERESKTATSVESAPQSAPYSTSVHPPDPIEGSVTVVTTPDKGESAVIELIKTARSEIRIQQVSMSDPDFPLIQAIIEAANRGVDVTILLDNSWYVQDENMVIRDQLFSAVDNPENVRVELHESTDRFEKIHTKGIIIDNHTAVVGSMNWNNVSMRENREVMVVIESADAAEFYTGVFQDDWNTPGQRTPIGFLFLTICVWIIAGLIARYRIEIAA